MLRICDELRHSKTFIHGLKRAQPRETPNKHTSRLTLRSHPSISNVGRIAEPVGQAALSAWDSQLALELLRKARVIQPFPIKLPRLGFSSPPQNPLCSLQ